MSNIVILIGDKPDHESEGYQTYQGLQELARDTYTVTRYRDVEFYIALDDVRVVANGIPLTEYDLVYIRDFHGYEPERNTIADYCAQHGVAFVNADVAISQKISKLAQYMAFSSRHVPFPRTVYAHPSRLADAAENMLAYPMIVKSILARSGNDNYLVSSREELDALLVDRPTDKFVAQEAVPNKGDYRVIVLGDTASCVYLRTAKEGDHRNNVSQGGDKQYLNVDSVPDAITSAAINAAHAVGRDICGVDVMIDERDGMPTVLEANFNFGIRAVPGVLSEELYGLSEYLHRRAQS